MYFNCIYLKVKQILKYDSKCLTLSGVTTQPKNTETKLLLFNIARNYFKKALFFLSGGREVGGGVMSSRWSSDVLFSGAVPL